MAEKVRVYPPKFFKKKFRRVHIFVSGKVQGVFFRSTAREKASELGLTGWVKNLPDGRVEILTEGDEERVEELIKWVKRGPEMAKVTGLDIEWERFKDEFGSFEIKYD